MAVAGESADDVHGVVVLVFEGEINRVCFDGGADGGERGNLRMDVCGQMVVRKIDLVYAMGKQLQRVEVAARDLFSPVDDEDVVAKVFGFAEDLRSEDDGSSFLDFGTQKIHYLTLQDGIHPGREFIQEKHGRIDHEDFRDLQGTTQTAAQIPHPAVDFRAELKFHDQSIGTARRRRFVESLEARVGKPLI